MNRWDAFPLQQPVIQSNAPECSYYLCHFLSLCLSGFVVIPCSRLCAKAKAQGQGCGYDFLFSVTAEDTGLPLTRLFASHSSPCLHASNSTLPLSLPTSLLSFPSLPPLVWILRERKGGVGHSGTMWLPALGHGTQWTEAFTVSMVGPPDAQPGSCLRGSFCHHWQP